MLSTFDELTKHDLAVPMKLPLQPYMLMPFEMLTIQGCSHWVTLQRPKIAPVIFAVIDNVGNMVSLTNTLLSRFGSKVVAPSLGLTMNNGMMWFDPRTGQPNSIAGGATPLANMSPVIAVREGKPEIAIGAAGGRQIFPAVAQILSRLIDKGESPEAAIHAPRIDASSPTIRVNRKATHTTATAISVNHPVQITEDTLYPVQFAIPTLVESRR